jgi:hypothetical protein
MLLFHTGQGPSGLSLLDNQRTHLELSALVFEIISSITNRDLENENKRNVLTTPFYIATPHALGIEATPRKTEKSF